MPCRSPSHKDQILLPPSFRKVRCHCRSRHLRLDRRRHCRRRRAPGCKEYLEAKLWRTDSVQAPPGDAGGANEKTVPQPG